MSSSFEDLEALNNLKEQRVITPELESISKNGKPRTVNGSHESWSDRLKVCV